MFLRLVRERTGLDGARSLLAEISDDVLSSDELSFVSTDTPIDLTNCDREPIHIPGAIQPHGALLALDDETFTVRMASGSCVSHLGVSAQDAIGRSLASLVGDAATRRLRTLISPGSERRSDVIVADGGAISGRSFDATLHRSGGLSVLELEPSLDDVRLTPHQMTATMRSTVDRLEAAESLADVAEGVANEMRAITGFDRVWVYKFHPDWHGEIIGESRRDDIETWLGMHYPASDIPTQARALFLKNWLRVIPDIGFKPSPLVPTLNPLSNEPLDLGNSVLRSVSPIHIQYLTNMGVTASLVISLIHRGKLWGLISGHHYSGPKRVPYGVRVMCEFLAQALSLQIGVTDRLADREYALDVRARQSRLLEELGTGEDFQFTLTRGAVTLADAVDADGAAVVRGSDITTVGSTPNDFEIAALVRWLRTRTEDLVETNALSRELESAEPYRRVASGLMAVPISRDRADQLLWFRAERRQTVRWAGDPRKPVTIDANGSARLHPRGSFELWEEEVSGTSTPWEPVTREAAREIRRAVLDVLIHRAEEIARLNEELVATNTQLEETAVELEMQAQELINQRELREQLLDSERHARDEAEAANRAKADFLAVMSHELRTPLNAIGGYAQLMATGVRGPTTPQQLADLERIQVNQRHLLGLINSILHFSKLEAGAVQMNMGDVQVAPLLGSMDILVAPQMRSKSIRFHVGECDEQVTVAADEDKLRQVLLNLLTNALKFTPSGGVVELACRPGGEGRIEITVTDTGIGIPQESIQAIFEPFVQVGRNRTPGGDHGVGLGLSISRELARAMGGELVATSEVNKGSTFILSLQSAR